MTSSLTSSYTSNIAIYYHSSLILHNSYITVRGSRPLLKPYDGNRNKRNNNKGIGEKI